jgi:hypothetical protein
VRHARGSAPVTPAIISLMVQAIDAMKTDVRNRALNDGAAFHRGYDILKRRLPQGYAAQITTNINAAVAESREGTLWDRATPSEWPAAGDARFSMANYLTFIEGIPHLPGHDLAASDPRMLAIAFARSRFDSRDDWSASDLNRIGVSVMRAIYAAGRGHINAAHVAHKPDVARTVSKAVEQHLARGHAYASYAGVIAAFLTLPAVCIGAAVIRKEDKPENALMAWGMKILACMDLANATMSNAFVRACEDVIEQAGNGRRAKEFGDMFSALKPAATR